MSKVIHVARGEAGDGNRLCPMVNHGYVLIPICIYPASQTYEQREACSAGHCTTCWRGEDLDAAGPRSPVGWAVGTEPYTGISCFLKVCLMSQRLQKTYVSTCFLIQGQHAPQNRRKPRPTLSRGDHTHHPSFQPPSIQHPRALRRIREHLCSIRICVACPLARRVLNYKKSLRQLVRVSAECKTGRNQVYSV